MRFANRAAALLASAVVVGALVAGGGVRAASRPTVMDYMPKLGFSVEDLAALERGEAVTRVLKGLTPVPRPVVDRQRSWGDTTWVEPRWRCEVRYASMASTGTLREPVFVRLCNDIDTRYSIPRSCQDRTSNTSCAPVVVTEP